MVNYLLLWTLAVPLAGAAVAVLCPDRVGRWVAAVAALLTFGLTIPLGIGRQPGMWHELNWAWVPDFGLEMQLGVDGISYPLVVLTGLLTLLCCGYSIWHTPKPGRGNLLGA
jgi:NADH-quinone oxidoreductase subunit M